jgi:hypothetical protein
MVVGEMIDSFYHGHKLTGIKANVAPPLRDGIERYLAETLKPKVGEAFPQAPPIAVNLPW